jgi:hypothetical protein
MGKIARNAMLMLMAGVAALTVLLGVPQSAAAQDVGGNGNPLVSCPGGYVVASAPITRSNGQVVGRVELWWAWSCGGNWARTTSYIGAQPLQAQVIEADPPKTGAWATDTAAWNVSPFIRVASNRRMCAIGVGRGYRRRTGVALVLPVTASATRRTTVMTGQGIEQTDHHLRIRRPLRWGSQLVALIVGLVLAAAALPATATAETLGGIDFVRVCAEQNGGPQWRPALLEQNIDGWRCRDGGDQQRAIDMDWGCRIIYGAGATATYSSFTNPNSWVCRR